MVESKKDIHIYTYRQVYIIYFDYRFKNNGENFQIMLPVAVKEKSSHEVSVPEDLIQIQAYLRWERKGKQMYTPEQEKVSNQLMSLSCIICCFVFVKFINFGISTIF